MHFTEQNHNKKRVLFIITQSEMGGAQRFLLNFLSKINKDRFEFLVCTGKNGGNEIIESLKENEVSYHLLRFLKRNVSPLNDIIEIFEIRKLINSWRPDSLFLLSSKAGFIGSLASIFPFRFKNLKVIYRIGGWSFNDPVSVWRKKLWTFLEKLSSRWKDVIILNNLQDLKQAIKLKIKPRQEIKLIYNGLDIYKMNFLESQEAKVKLYEKVIKQSGKIFQAKHIIGTIANFYPAKNLENLIESANQFRDNDEIVFFIIGDGEERDKLTGLINKLGLDKKVFLTGKINDAYKYLKGFDIFVLTSVKEGFPWALIEAMSAKLPVIATNVGAIPEIIENHKNGILIESGEPEQISKAINEILSNDRLRQELAIQGHQTVLFKFNLEKMSNQIESLL